MNVPIVGWPLTSLLHWFWLLCWTRPNEFHRKQELHNQRYKKDTSRTPRGRHTLFSPVHGQKMKRALTLSGSLSSSLWLTVPEHLPWTFPAVLIHTHQLLRLTCQDRSSFPSETVHWAYWQSCIPLRETYPGGFVWENIWWWCGTLASVLTITSG